MFSSQHFLLWYFPRELYSPAVWAREITHLLKGSFSDTHTQRVRKLCQALAHRSIHKSWCANIQEQCITSKPSRWSSQQRTQRLTGYVKVRGHHRAGFELRPVWVVLGVYKKKIEILCLRMYPLHLQMELRYSKEEFPGELQITCPDSSAPFCCACSLSHTQRK